MADVRPFIWSKQEQYFAVEDRRQRRRLERMKSAGSPCVGDAFEHYPHREPKREGQNEYNYDSPFYESHGKRGRK